MATATLVESAVPNVMLPHFLFQLLKDHQVEDPSQILIVNDNPKSVLSTASCVSRSSSSASDRTATPQTASAAATAAAASDIESDSEQEIITVATLKGSQQQHVERWGNSEQSTGQPEYDSDSVLQLARLQRSSAQSNEPFKVKRTDKWMGDSKPNSDSSLSMPKRKSSLEASSIEQTSQQALAKGAAIAAGKDTAPQRPPRKGKRPSKVNSMGGSAASSSHNSAASSSAATTALGSNAYISQNKSTRKQGRRASLNTSSTSEQRQAWAAAIAKSPPRPEGRKKAPRRSSMDNAFITTDKAMELNLSLSNHSTSSSSSSASLKSPPTGRRQRRASMDTAYSMDISNHSAAVARPTGRKQRRASMDTSYSTASMDISAHSVPPRPPRPTSSGSRKARRRASMGEYGYSIDMASGAPKPTSSSNHRKQARRASVDTALSTAIHISSGGAGGSFNSSNSRPPMGSKKSNSPPGQRKKQARRRASMDFSGFKTATTNTFSTLYSAPTSIAANLIQRHRNHRNNNSASFDFKNRKAPPPPPPPPPMEVTPPTTPRVKKKSRNSSSSSTTRNSSQAYQANSKTMSFAMS